MDRFSESVSKVMSRRRKKTRLKGDGAIAPINPTDPNVLKDPQTVTPDPPPENPK